MRRISRWSRSRSSGLEWSTRQARSEITPSGSRRHIHLLRTLNFGSLHLIMDPVNSERKRGLVVAELKREAMNNEPRRKSCTCPTVNARKNAHTIRRWQHRAFSNRNLSQICEPLLFKDQSPKQLFEVCRCLFLLQLHSTIQNCCSNSLRSPNSSSSQSASTTSSGTARGCTYADISRRC